LNSETLEELKTSLASLPTEDIDAMVAELQTRLETSVPGWLKILGLAPKAPAMSIADASDVLVAFPGETVQHLVNCSRESSFGTDDLKVSAAIQTPAVARSSTNLDHQRGRGFMKDTPASVPLRHRNLDGHTRNLTSKITRSNVSGSRSFS
jgi:hypothetical protein